MNEYSCEIDWCEVARKHFPDSGKCRVFRILEDTTDFYEVEYGDVVLLNNVGYLIRGTESEKKFGLEGEPKPWVKSCMDLTTDRRKILKLTFLEEFACTIHGSKFTCLRNPDKESRILDKVRGMPGFMQGFHALDKAGNNVRILDRVSGISLDNYIRSIPTNHETYYTQRLPRILKSLAQALDALADLHDLGEIHGDITPDHIFKEFVGDRYVWIDFDYDYKDYDDLSARDLYETGAMLSFVVGKEYRAYRDLLRIAPDAAARLTPADMLPTMPNVTANLKAVYPYIDEDLHHILMRFSQGSRNPYTSARELASDVGRVAAELDGS